MNEQISAAVEMEVPLLMQRKPVARLCASVFATFIATPRQAMNYTGRLVYEIRAAGG